MSGLKKRLSFMFTSGLERNIQTLFNSKVTGYIDEEACEALASVLENKSSKYSRQEALDCIVKQTGKTTTWNFALRALMVFHKLTHIQGDLLTDLLTNNQMEAIAKLKVPSTPLKTQVHSAMASHYYKYLQKLSYNYEDLSICFYTNTDFPQRLKENNLSVMHFLSKVQNMLKYLVEILPLCETSLTQLEATDIVKQITYFCLTDCYYYYAYTSHTISIMIDGILNLEQQDALFLFELYCENIQITNQLKPLFQLRTHIRQFSLKIPNFFEIDVDLNQRVEQYITSLKQGSIKAPEKKSSKGKFVSNLEIDVEADEDPELAQKLAPSLQDFSNVLVQITTPNFKSIQKKELFKPPVLNRKENNPLSPRVKILSPNDQNKIDGPGGNLRGLSSFNPFTAKENYLKVNNGEVTAEVKTQNPFFKSVKDESKTLETTTPVYNHEESALEGISATRQVSS